MRIFKIIFFYILIVIFMPIDVTAQSNDSERIKQDVRIMEVILDELFKSKWSAYGSRMSAVFYGNKSHSSEGLYLDDYGLIFIIQGGAPGFVAFSDSDDQQSAFLFEHSDSGEQEPVNKKTVKKRIERFLTNYAPSLSRLSEDQKVMVLYKSESRVPGVPVNRISDNKNSDNKPEHIPGISAVISAGDLSEHRKGKLGLDELRKRIKFSILEGGSSLDLKVMANIIETTLNDQNSKAFRVRGDVSHVYLDDFGAVFSLDLNHSSFPGFFGTLVLDDLDIDFPKSLQSGEIPKLKSAEDARQYIDSINKARKEREEERDKEIINAYQTTIQLLKEVIVDYGRTLKTVSSDQRIMLAVNFGERTSKIPEKVYLEINKSVLEKMDRGSVSRDEAIEQVTVREF